MWCPAKMYNILFPNGAYKQKTTEDWLHGLTMPNPDVVNENIQTVHEHEAHDAYWNKIELNDADYANVDFPYAHFSGWYDLFVVGNLEAWKGYNTKSDPSVRQTGQITIDCCGHCLEAGEYFTQHAIDGRTGLVLGQILKTYGIIANERSGKSSGQLSNYVLNFYKILNDINLHINRHKERYFLCNVF